MLLGINNIAATVSAFLSAIGVFNILFVWAGTVFALLNRATITDTHCLVPLILAATSIEPLDVDQIPLGYFVGY